MVHKRAQCLMSSVVTFGCPTIVHSGRCHMQVVLDVHPHRQTLPAVTECTFQTCFMACCGSPCTGRSALPCHAGWLSMCATPDTGLSVPMHHASTTFCQCCSKQPLLAVQVGFGIMYRNGNVFKCHTDMWDTIFHAELGSSWTVLQAGYNIDSFMMRYQGIDWLDKRNWECNNRQVLLLGWDWLVGLGLCWDLPAEQKVGSSRCQAWGWLHDGVLPEY